MDTVTKSMDVTEADIESMIDGEVKRIDEVRPDDWTVSRVIEKYKDTESPLTTDQARKVLKRVFDPLVERGAYELIEAVNPKGRGGSRVHAYRRKV